jgi:DnaJ-class molecular chaperone
MKCPTPIHTSPSTSQTQMNFDILMNPEKYGYEMCPHCNGYGSSLKDPVGVNSCTKCGGVGLVKKPEAT